MVEIWGGCWNNKWNKENVWSVIRKLLVVQLKSFITLKILSWYLTQTFHDAVEKLEERLLLFLVTFVFSIFTHCFREYYSRTCFTLSLEMFNAIRHYSSVGKYRRNTFFSQKGIFNILFSSLFLHCIFLP